MTNLELIETLQISGMLENVNDVYYNRVLKSTSKDINIYDTFKILNTLGLRVGLNLELHGLFLNCYNNNVLETFRVDFEQYYKWIKAIKDFCITKDINVYTNMFMSSFVKHRHNMDEALKSINTLYEVEQLKVGEIIYDIDSCFRGIGSSICMILTRHDDKVGKILEENIVNYLLIKDSKLIKGYTDKIKEDNYDLIIRA